MANEANVSINVTVASSGQSAIGTLTSQFDATTAFIGNEQIIGTTDETIQMGDVPSLATFVFVKNMDATNYVTIDSASTYDKWPQVILPGKGVFLIPGSNVIHVKANTAPCKIFVVAGG